jgi:iron complex outermembrane receptor protein
MNLHRITAAGALAISVAFAASAQSEEAPATNAPIIVTASRTGRSADEIASGVTVITADEIKRSGATDVVQALEKLGGLYFRKSGGNPSSAEVSMRGFGENSHGRTLILVNGERLNSLDMAAPNLLRVPFGSIERIEVLRGAQTILYGDFAGAGVINIITRPGADKPTTTVAATVGSQNTFGGSVSTAGRLDDALRYAVDAHWQKSDGWRKNSDFETMDVRVSLGKDWNARATSTLSLFYNTGDYGMPGALTPAQMRANPRQTTHPLDEGSSQSWGLALDNSFLVGEDGTLRLNVAASRRLIDSQNDYRAWGYWFYYGSGLDSLTFSPSYSDRYQIAGVENRITVGADIRRDALAMNYAYNPEIPLWGVANKAFDLTRVSLAGYVENETFLSDTLSLILGARADRIASESAVNGTEMPDVNSTEHALSASVLYRPSQQVKLYAQAASLYHAPFADEQVNIWGPTPVVADLEPETGLNQEAGAVVRFAEEWETGMSLYQLDLQNEIVYNPLTWKNENTDDTRRRGMEANLSWRRPGVASLSAFYTFVDAEFDAGPNAGKEIPLVPQHVLTVHGDWSVIEDLALLATFRATSNQRSGGDFRNVANRLDGFGVLDTGVRITPSRVSGLTLIFSVDNVFDKHYATTGFFGSSVYPANGRTWTLTASYTF